MTNPTRAHYSAFLGDTNDHVARWRSLPLSWSQLDCWRKSKSQWLNRYILGKKGHQTPEMALGSAVGDKLADDPSFFPDFARLPFYEYTLKKKYKGIPLIAHIDNYDHGGIIHEFKTGKDPWDLKRVDDHGQLTFYAMMVWLCEKIDPEDQTIKLLWLPTRNEIVNDEHGQVLDLVLTGEVFEFPTKRTTGDVVRFLGGVMKDYRAMETYAQNALAQAEN